MDLCRAPGLVPGRGGLGALPLAGSAGGAAPGRAPGPAAHPARSSHSVPRDLQPLLPPCKKAGKLLSTGIFASLTPGRQGRPTFLPPRQLFRSEPYLGLGPDSPARGRALEAPKGCSRCFEERPPRPEVSQGQTSSVLSLFQKETGRLGTDHSWDASHDQPSAGDRELLRAGFTFMIEIWA